MHIMFGQVIETDSWQTAITSHGDWSRNTEGGTAPADKKKQLTLRFCGVEIELVESGPDLQEAECVFAADMPVECLVKVPASETEGGVSKGQGRHPPSVQTPSAALTLALFFDFF